MFVRQQASSSSNPKCSGFIAPPGALCTTPSFQQELRGNERVIRRAEQQRQQVAQPQKPMDGLEGNRDRLNTLFDTAEDKLCAQPHPGPARQLSCGSPGKKKKSRSAEPTSLTASGWITTHLAVARVRPSRTGRDEKGPTEVGETRYREVASRARPGAGKHRRPARQDWPNRKLGANSSSRPKRQRRSRRSRRKLDDEAMSRYQQQRLQQQRQQREVQEADRDAYDQRGDDTLELEGLQLRLADSSRVTSAGLAGEPSLASLAFEFPVRGVAYRFTTPRGEVAITARAVSDRSVDTMKRLGLVLLALAIYAGLYKFVERISTRRAGYFLQPEGKRKAARISILLVFLGVVSAVGGVLPVIGIVAVIAGVVIWIAPHRSPQSV